MLKKKGTVLILLPLILILAACASLKLPGTTTSTGASAQQNQNQQGQNQQGQPFNMAKQPVEQKLAIGTLKLEGTDKAVTAEQAKALLPLWKAVKTMSTNTSTSQAEMDALYKQIEEAMTADQVQAIKDLSMTPEDTQGLMKQYNIQAPQPGNFPTLSPDQQATRQARRSSSGSGTNSSGGQSGGRNGQGGGFPGGDFGGPPPDGMFPGGSAGGTGGTNGATRPNAQGTPQAGFAGRGGFRGGMNNMFIDPLIKVLQERAGVAPSAQATPTVQ